MLCLAWACAASAQELPCPARGMRYEVHVLNGGFRVDVLFRADDPVELQLPVWNALYQVRDFSQYMTNVSAAREITRQGWHASDRVLSGARVTSLDKTTWRVDNPNGCNALSYSYHADSPGPFGIQANAQHAFINWALLLVYRVGHRDDPVQVAIWAPSDWKLCDGGYFGCEAARKDGVYYAAAPGYDALVDSPVEIGRFINTSFEQDGATYHVAAQGAITEAELQKISANLKKISAAAVDWMQDRPCREYTFIYHFPRGPAAGGMEHSCSTVIDVNADRLQDPLSYAGVSAHEFFHLWNVKRIRPQSLEPIDFTGEQYTRALWFSEGVTSTVAEHLLVRAGMLDENRFLQRLAQQIGELESRPARKFQSVEESSLDTWFDKYSFYRTPERSISYYNKGQIVGVLMDLKIRQASGGQRSLRDLFHYMNERWAKQGKYFDDSESVRLAAQVLTGDDFREFFEGNISGTRPLPYDLFETVGLRLVRKKVQAANPGFTTSRGFGASPIVSTVDEGSEAAEYGLTEGDVITSINGKPLNGDVSSALRSFKPGEEVRFGVRSREGEREINLQLGARASEQYVLEDMPLVSEPQKARRDAWLHGDSEAKEGSTR